MPREEAKRLAAAGTKEIQLIAQDTSAWGTDLYGASRLPALLHRLGEVEGIRWIRLMYCYEERITDELIRAMANEPKVCHYIDILPQHASEGAARDGTQVDKRQHLATNRLRSAIPDIHDPNDLYHRFSR